VSCPFVVRFVRRETVKTVSIHVQVNTRLKPGVNERVAERAP